MKRFLLGLIGLGILVSCESESNNSGSGTTPISIKMTDAPGKYDKILLNVDQVEILTSGGRKTIDVDDNIPFDILKFTMGKDTLLAGDIVPSGFIQEVRLILDDEGNSIVVDGVSHPLTTPSGQSSGVKLKVQDELIPDIAYTLLLDFDAAASITTTGNGKYILKPVIRTIPNAVSGVIRGTILPLEAAVKVYIQVGAERIGAVTNATGAFYFPGIENGTYTIIIEPENALYQSKTITGVVVENGVVKNLGEIRVELK